MTHASPYSSPSHLLGILLAGGRSRRMGQDKALLSFNGLTLLQHTEALLSRVGCNEVIISRNSDGYVKDIFSDKGPLSGIYSVLQTTNAGSVLVMPVDMPLMTPTALLYLINYGQKLQRVCHYQASFLPCYLPDATIAQQQLHQILSGTHYSIGYWLTQLQCLALDHSQAGFCHRIFSNNNTPEEWQTLLKILGNTVK